MKDAFTFERLFLHHWYCYHPYLNFEF